MKSFCILIRVLVTPGVYLSKQAVEWKIWAFSHVNCTKVEKRPPEETSRRRKEIRVEIDEMQGKAA